MALRMAADRWPAPRCRRVGGRRLCRRRSSRRGILDIGEDDRRRRPAARDGGEVDARARPRAPRARRRVRSRRRAAAPALQRRRRLRCAAALPAAAMTVRGGGSGGGPRRAAAHRAAVGDRAGRTDQRERRADRHRLAGLDQQLVDRRRPRRSRPRSRPSGSPPRRRCRRASRDRPACFSHSTSVPASMSAPSEGMRNSLIAAHHGRARGGDDGGTCGRAASSRCLG